MEICSQYKEILCEKYYVTLGIRRAKHRAKRGASHRILSLYKKTLELGKIPSSPHVGSGTCKNPEPTSPYKLWNLEERSDVQSSYIPFFLNKGPETWKNDALIIDIGSAV